MARATVASPPNADAQDRNVSMAFDEVMKFSPVIIGEKADEAIRSKAQEEAAFGRVSVDENGLSGGMRLYLVQPIRKTLADWTRVKGGFTTAIRPFMNDIEALGRLDEEIRELRLRRENLNQSIERKADDSRGYRTAKEHYQRTKIEFEELRNRQGGRPPNLKAYSILYWIALFAVMIAEYMINYETFFFFLGVKAIAMGTTAIMGVLLAYAAHWHGTLLRQWDERFGGHARRFVPVSMLLFATFSLVLVVAAAGGSRYEFAMSIIIDQPHQNILGQSATIEVNPVKDVTLSLLGNIAAWAVGVYLSFMCHDISNEYMEKANEARKAERRYEKLRRPFLKELRRREAEVEKEIEEKERSATLRSREFQRERSMLNQVTAHEETVMASLTASFRQSIETYRSALTQIALSSPGTVHLMQGEKELTPYEYQELKVPVDPHSLRAIAA
jgi:hypothetical protein